VLPQIAPVIGFRIDIEKGFGESDAVSAKVPQRVGQREARGPANILEWGKAFWSAAQAHKPIAAILRAPEDGVGAAKLAEGFRDYLACYEWDVGPDDDQGSAAASVENALHALPEAAPALGDTQGIWGITPHPSPLPVELALASSQPKETASASGCGWERESARACNTAPSPLAGEGQDEGFSSFADEWFRY